MRISDEELEKCIKSWDRGPLFFSEDALLDLRDLRAAARAVIAFPPCQVHSADNETGARYLVSLTGKELDALRAALAREGREGEE